MARLIDADKRISEIKKHYCDGCDNYGGAKCRACWVDDAMCLIEDATTVDAVPVVRCRECKHYEMGVCLKIYSDGAVSQYAWQARNEDDFCSYGERKDGGKDA